ncbi:MAG: PQQ-binding-like beta-propeller repeat protein [Bacteroidetes bacterium]|nr:MAG: PQQ-binding-like beta-propeller repeat protein [Bacteroidota bacterium]
MKRYLPVLFTALVLFSCKEDTNPVIVDPPNPFAQTAIAWPSLQNAPWPMYRHDPQLTGRSQYAGPTKGIISDTVNVMPYSVLYCGITIDKNNNAFIPFDFRSTENLWSYNLISKTIQWKSTIPQLMVENINMPTVTSNGNIIFSSRDLCIISPNGQVVHQNNTPFIAGFTSSVDKAGNIYYMRQTPKSFFCMSSSGTPLWTISDARMQETGYALSFSPDGKTMYVPCETANDLVALDVSAHDIIWSFGTTGLFTPPLIDNQGHIYYHTNNWQSNTDDTLYCLNPNGSVRWLYRYHKVQPITSYYGVEPLTIDRDGNIIALAPRDTIVSLTNDGKLRWKLPLTAYKGTEQLVCDVNGTIYCATWDNHVLAISKSGSILWSLKLSSSNDTWFASPSLADGKLIVTGATDKIYIIE